MSATVVGICTCRNPDGLARLLDELARTTAASPPALVIVVDNDTGGAGLAVAAARRAALPFAMLAVTEEKAGIPFARNRVIEEARKTSFDHVAMIDDDEYPGDGWLDALVSAARQADADVVGGPVEPVFAIPPTPPVTVADFAKPGGRMVRGRAIVESTANVLLSRRLLERSAPDWFRGAFASMSGGSDAEFFRRSLSIGARHAIAPEALVYETVGPDRTQPEWLVRRHFSNGNKLARIRTLHHGVVAAAVVETANSAALVGSALLDMARGPMDPDRRFRARLKLSRVAGKMAGLARHADSEYARSRYRNGAG